MPCASRARRLRKGPQSARVAWEWIWRLRRAILLARDSCETHLEGAPVRLMRSIRREGTCTSAHHLQRWASRSAALAKAFETKCQSCFGQGIHMRQGNASMLVRVYMTNFGLMSNPTAAAPRSRPASTRVPAASRVNKVNSGNTIAPRSQDLGT